MKSKKTHVLSFISSFAAVSFFAMQVFAQVTPLSSPTGKVGTIYDFVAVILGILIKISIPFLALAIIFAGFVFVTAQGDPKKIALAKNMFRGVVIGAIIILGAVALSRMLENTIRNITS